MLGFREAVLWPQGDALRSSLFATEEEHSGWFGTVGQTKDEVF